MTKFLIIIFLVIVIIGVISSFLEIFLNKDNSILEQRKIYERKVFLTNAEKVFYSKLINIEKYGYVVIPQVNLASIINKDTKYSKYQTELFRNVDFAIFDKTMNYPLLLIELNDITHKSQKRRERDKKVKNICECANLKLITFYNKYDNKEEYIIKRVLDNIKENENDHSN